MLYVPGLNINLLSEQKLCKADLREKFNKNILYLNDNSENRIVIYTRRNDIYYVKIIKKILIQSLSVSD